MTEVVKKSVFKKWWFWLIVILVLAAIGQVNREEQSGAKDTKTAGPAAQVSKQASPTIVLPADQQNFIKIIADAQTKARSAENDMQRGGIKSEREKALCLNAALFQRVENWVGKLEKIDANSDGKGVLSIEIAKDVVVKTWNNAVSDIGDKTLIEPGTPLFTTASQMKRGALVKFSGNFFRGGEGDCARESSLSLSGKLQDPEFIFRFESVAPYSP